MDLFRRRQTWGAVSNLAYDVAKELGLGEKECYQLAIAGMLHEMYRVCSIKWQETLRPRANQQMVIEELKYVRMHSNS